MQIRFLARTMPEYQGADGNGGNLVMKRNDSAEVSDAVCKALLRHYPRDFAKEEPIKEHAAKEDKMAKKSTSYKSK